ncbi:hypothetical protein O181_028121 [Austropuccinia psidii MF-1]|uniref:Integrase catalytic domain-containing protein n=1 Tax=Austropuccinia psidii MF-1 TaxID=1389203 RepID=A0A9Q3CTU7_9BASI|nr:hypothetical protein [Austropuccinia psidii MF-1]
MRTNAYAITIRDQILFDTNRSILRLHYHQVLKTERRDFCFLQRVQGMGRKLSPKKNSKNCVRREGEFINNCFKNYAKIEGFEHSISPLYTPEHNGIAERGNRSVLEKARCLMQQTKLTDQFWAEATSTATFLLNVAEKHDNISP